MAFPTSPTNGQVSTVNGISYIYASATGSWTRTSSGINPLLIGSNSTVIIGNTLSLNSANISTSTTTGALVVGGGAGIAGNVFAGNVLATGFFYANGIPFVSDSGSTSTSGNLDFGSYTSPAGFTFDLGTF